MACLRIFCKLWFRPANIREKLTCPATILLQKALLGVLSLLAPVGMACGCRARYSKYGGPEEPAGSEEVPSPVAGTMGEQAQARVLQDYSVEKSVEGALRAIDYVLKPA